MFGRRRGYRRGFGGGGGLGMMLLAMQLFKLFQFLSNSNEYYPISLGVLGLNLIAYFQPGRNWPSIQQACISVRGVWFDRQWKRIFLASFYHSSDFHLYYNMASFIWKAISLERHFGSGYFLYMVTVFSITTNLVYLAINYALAEILDQWSYINSCAVGFSGVLFALKVVTTHIHPAGMTRVMGFIPVPMRIACWVELVLISVLFPHVSFVGHLAGILVGFAFIYGPLRVIMDIPLSLITGMIHSLEMVKFDDLLSDTHRRIAIVIVSVFMILFPILLDLVPSGPGTGEPHNTEGRSYTYRAGTTGRRREQPSEQQQAERSQPSSQHVDRQYQSYTYAAGVSGQREEESELQEAIRRSLSRSTQGPSDDGEENTTSSPGITDPPRPPPFNPSFSSENSNNVSEPHSNVGWNRDLLESNEDRQDQPSRPLGFDAVHSETNSMPVLASENEGTEIRQRRNQNLDSGSLTREAVREARLLRLGGGGDGGGVNGRQPERQRTPLSELSRQSFTFKK